jgi:hypothetical protein
VYKSQRSISGLMGEGEYQNICAFAVCPSATHGVYYLQMPQNCFGAAEAEKSWQFCWVFWLFFWRAVMDDSCVWQWNWPFSQWYETDPVFELAQITNQHSWLDTETEKFDTFFLKRNIFDLLRSAIKRKCCMANINDSDLYSVISWVLIFQCNILYDILTFLSALNFSALQEIPRESLKCVASTICAKYFTVLRLWGNWKINCNYYPRPGRRM